MNKTRSLIGKTLLATLILMLLSVPFMTKASAYSAAALPVPTIFSDPIRVEGNAGDDVVLSIKVTGVQVSQPMFGFQLGLKFDNNTVGAWSHGVLEGGFLSGNGADTVILYSGTVNNMTGIITPWGWTLTSIPAAKSGDGLLMTFKFHMLVTGYSDIHFWEWYPTDNTGEEIPFKQIDYFTAVVASTQYIVKTVGNPQGGGINNGYSARNVTAISIVNGPNTYLGQFSFNVTATGATPDRFAFFNVTIPKALMSCPTTDQWWVLRNDVTNGARIIAENNDNTTISLSFAYGTTPTPIAFKIRSIDIVPEFSSVFFASLLVLATFAAALFSKTAWSHKRKS